VRLFIKNCFSLLLLLLFAGDMLHAQNASQIDVLTTEDGLIFRNVESITQDKTGRMWFGTSQGLNRYDGHRFKAYTNDASNPFYIESDDILYNMAPDPSGNYLWYLADYTLFKLDLRNDIVTKYDTDFGIVGETRAMFLDPKGILWLVTQDEKLPQGNKETLRLQKIENDKLTEIDSQQIDSANIVGLTTDALGNIWWGTINGVSQYSASGKLLQSQVLDTYIWNDDEINFTELFFDRCNNQYYFPKSEGTNGVYLYNSNDKSSEKILNVSEHVFRAIEDRKNHIWFAGKTSLWRLNPDGTTDDFSEILNEELDFSMIKVLYVDNQNILWVGTDNGLFKVRSTTNLFSNLFSSKDQRWGNAMRDIFEGADGTIYGFCENKDAIFYKNKRGETGKLKLSYETDEKLVLRSTAIFFIPDETKKHVYTAARSLLKINLETGLVKKIEGFEASLRMYGANPISKLNDGRLLFGYSLYGLTIYDPKTEKSEKVFKNTSAIENIPDLRYFEPSIQENIVWIATENDGLLKINLAGSIEAHFKTETKPSLSKNQLLVVEEDTDGSVWIGTYGGGLNHLSADEKTVKIYKRTAGLPNDNVVGILMEDADYLWVSTYNGLSYFNKEAATFQNFYTEDGVSHNEFNYTSTHKGEDGMFYFGGMNGVTAFSSNSVLNPSVAPELVFAGISGYNSRLKSSFVIDQSYREGTAVSISPYDQYFQVEWSMPSYFQNKKNTYSTKLEGFEDTWFSQGNTASVRYNKLPAGEYLLKIKGADARGNQTSSILSIPITVRQIFYKKWWFIILVLLVNAGIVYALFKWRLQQLLELERLRTKISSDLHDDVGSLLSGLAMQTELLEMNASQEDKSKLQKIAAISRSAISQMRDLVWSIDSRRNTSNDLIERMHELAEELLLPRDISFTIDSTGTNQGNKKLPPPVKQNLFLIYKESITNLLKHSDASHLQITIENHAKGCVFLIKDNGSVKDNYSSTGLGLANIELRAKTIGGTVTFETDNGFAIRLELPFNL
jgi:ligand-binding sensor domain-containing protein/two-component sensor histidine kinase